MLVYSIFLVLSAFHCVSIANLQVLTASRWETPSTTWAGREGSLVIVIVIVHITMLYCYPLLLPRILEEDECMPVEATMLHTGSSTLPLALEKVSLCADCQCMAHYPWLRSHLLSGSKKVGWRSCALQRQSSWKNRWDLVSHLWSTFPIA